MIQTIALKNFRSYKNEVIKDFSPHNNLILGKNGQGKSNLLAAILFVFSDQFNREIDQATLHNQSSNQNLDCSVEITLEIDEPTQKQLSLHSNLVKLTRTWTSDKQDLYFLNQKPIKIQQFDNFLQCLGIYRNNVYNIIKQNQIQEITKMNKEEIFQLLEQVIGTQQFKDKQQESLNILKQCNKTKLEIEEALHDISQRLEDLKDEKGNFTNSVKEEAHINIVKYLIYEKQIQEIEEKLNQIQKDDWDPEYQKLLGLKSLQQKNQRNLYSYSSNINTIQQKIGQITIEEKSLQKNLQEQKQRLQQKQMQECLQENKQQDIEIQIDNIQKQIQIQDKNLDIETKQLEKIQQEQQNLEAEINLCYMRNNKQDFQKELGKLKQQVKEVEQKIKDIQKNKDKLVPQDEELKKLKNTRKEQEKSTEESSKNIINQQKTIQKLKEEQIKIQKSKISFQEKSEKLKHEEGNLQYFLDKMLKKPIIYTYKQILAEGIDGVLGLLIDFIDFQKDTQLISYFDIASKKKLFNLIVTDQNAANKVIDFIRRKNLPSIDIQPLDWVSESDRVKFPEDDVLKLVTEYKINEERLQGDNKMTIKKQIDIALKNIFSHWCVVENLELAQVHSRNNLNCITLDGQISFAGGFLNQVGTVQLNTTVDNNKLLMYFEYNKIYKEKIQNEMQIQQNEKKKTEIQNQINNIEKDINNEQIKINQFNNQITQLFTEIKNLIGSKINQQQYEKELNNQLQIQNRNLISLKDQVQNINNTIKNKKIGALDKNEQKNLEEQEKKFQSNIQKLKEQITKVQDSQQELDMKNQQIRMLLKSENIDMKNQEKIVESEKSIEKKIQTIEKQKQNLQKEIEEGQDNLKTITKENYEYQQDINKTQQEIAEKEAVLQNVSQKKINFIQSKNNIKEKQSAFEQVQDEKWFGQYQNSSKKQLQTVFKEIVQSNQKKYTLRDKLLFEKLASLEEKHAHFQMKYSQIQNSEQSLTQVQQQLEEICQDKVDEVFKVFSQYFNRYFETITNGKASIRKIRVGEGFGIHIMVSFSSGENNKNLEWNLLSGGQKSIVALTLIFALQRCNPSPFYILDEVDAALDSDYLKGIVNIINHNSSSDNNSNSQFIITTHKETLLQLKKSKFFKVEFQNNSSRVSEIQNNEAERLIAY